MEAGKEQVEVMSALDALLFRGDEHPRMLSVVGGLYLLDCEPRPRRIEQSLARAADAFPRLRQRAAVPPLRAVLPHWVADPQFAPADHLRRLTVPAPGSLRDVLDVILPELSAPLDADRPLWEALILTGLEGGHAALFFKMSHAMTDGMGAMQLFGALFDSGPAAPRGRSRPTPVPRSPAPDERLNRAWARMPRDLVGGALGLLPDLLGAARAATRDPYGAAASAEDYLASVRRVMGRPCPPASALAERSLARRCAVLKVPLPRLKQAARSLDATVNDLYLAAITGALRRYQSAVGAAPEDVPLAVPVNLRRGDEAAAGNHIGALNLVAPAAEPDPARRLEVIREAMQAGRSEPAIRAHSLLAPLMARMPDTVLERLLRQIPRADVQASNVPGPRERPYFAGRRVLAAYPFGPVPGVGAMVTMLSMVDECFVAVHFDPASFVEPETFATCLQQGFAEALEAGGQPAELGAPVLDHGPSPRRRKAR